MQDQSQLAAKSKINIASLWVQQQPTLEKEAEARIAVSRINQLVVRAAQLSR